LQGEISKRKNGQQKRKKQAQIFNIINGLKHLKIIQKIIEIYQKNYPTDIKNISNNIYLCENGVLDSRNCQFRSAMKKDFIRDKSSISFLPNNIPKTEYLFTILNRIFPNSETIQTFIDQIAYKIYGPILESNQKKVFFIADENPFLFSKIFIVREFLTVIFYSGGIKSSLGQTNFYVKIDIRGERCFYLLNEVEYDRRLEKNKFSIPEIVIIKLNETIYEEDISHERNLFQPPELHALATSLFHVCVQRGRQMLIKQKMLSLHTYFKLCLEIDFPIEEAIFHSLLFGIGTNFSCPIIK